MEYAERIYAELRNLGIDVLLDDRDARAGFKLKDADLIGIPLRVVIGGRGLKEGVAEVRWRWESDSRKVSLASAVGDVVEMLARQKIHELAKVPD